MRAVQEIGQKQEKTAYTATDLSFVWQVIVSRCVGVLEHAETHVQTSDSLLIMELKQT